MGLPRTFVGFSSTDIKSYYLMCAWKENEHIDFNFTDCQLAQEIRSEDEAYIKSKCKGRLAMAGYYCLLIGADTRSKHKYVRWEAEVAIEQRCTIIGISLDGSRRVTDQCPPILRNIGAVFVPYRPKIIAYALEHYKMHPNDDYHFTDDVYRKLGYTV
ncbi:MAG: hypothetical protein JWN94_2562 [Betaproteobacteria bacterium]|nr:hypothetical protein [Betaproteobacteria bacterium]